MLAALIEGTPSKNLEQLGFVSFPNSIENSHAAAIVQSLLLLIFKWTTLEENRLCNVAKVCTIHFTLSIPCNKKKNTPKYRPQCKISFLTGIGFRFSPTITFSVCGYCRQKSTILHPDPLMKFSV